MDPVSQNLFPGSALFDLIHVAVFLASGTLASVMQARDFQVLAHWNVVPTVKKAQIFW